MRARTQQNILCLTGVCVVLVAVAVLHFLGGRWWGERVNGCVVHGSYIICGRYRFGRVVVVPLLVGSKALRASVLVSSVGMYPRSESIYISSAQCSFYGHRLDPSVNGGLPPFHELAVYPVFQVLPDTFFRGGGGGRR
jgi:hypothetical protein